MDDKENEIDSLRQTILDLTGEVEGLEEENGVLERKIETLEGELERVKKELADTSKERDHYQTEWAKLDPDYWRRSC